MEAIPAPGLLALLVAAVVPLALYVALARILVVTTWRVPRWCELGLASRWAPLAAGLATGALTWWVWGSLDAPPVIHDEQAYVLQARILATGRWTGEPPPLPEFFEQMHVFVEPRLAAKYPPGHALLITPGIWVDRPGLMPVLLTAVAGALVFALARLVSTPTIALATWAFWATSSTNLIWRASYYSGITSAAAWLLAVWALWHWRASHRQWQLSLVVAALAWMYITRNLTAAALGVPIGVVVLSTCARRGAWRQLGLAALAALPMALLLVTWQHATVGDWLTNPWLEYARQYAPFDKPGFTTDRTPPLRAPSAEIEWFTERALKLHELHTPGMAPGHLLLRVGAVLLALGRDWRAWVILMFLIGVFRRSPVERFAAASIACLFGAYLVFAHLPAWTLYYLEIFPLVYLVAVRELGRVGAMATRGDARAAETVLAASLMLSAPALGADVRYARAFVDERGEFHRSAAQTLDAEGRDCEIVFVRYPPGHSYHHSLVVNTPDYRSAARWIVADRADHNARLLDTTKRSACRLDVGNWSVTPIRPRQ